MTDSLPQLPLSSELDEYLGSVTTRLRGDLGQVDDRVRSIWANPVVWRQPIHTCYVPANLLTSDTPRQWADVALSTLVEVFPSHDAGQSTGNDYIAALRELAEDLGVQPHDVDSVAQLTLKKLHQDPIEDLRIDFEDGFTQRGVALTDRGHDEDTQALRAAEVLSTWLENRSSPAFAGIRFKSFDPAVRDRGLRTLVIVLNELHRHGVLAGLYDPASADYAPRALRLTFPKVQDHRQVAALVGVFKELDDRYGLASPIRFEVQIETPQAIVNAAGGAEAARIVQASDGRCLSLHYGTYDYSASLGIDAAEQSMEHPVADYAKDVLQAVTSTVGVELSDGSTNRIPIGDRDSILAGWRLHYRLVRRHLSRGIRQGWDLHGAQLVTRHLATIAYFRENWEITAQRLRAHVTGDTSRWMDEPATAKAMAGYLRRAHACGAITDAELAMTGATADELARLHTIGRL